MKSEKEIRITEQRLAKEISELLSKAKPYDPSKGPTPEIVLFEDGMLCGKISALRWVIEAEWESFYKNKEL